MEESKRIESQRGDLIIPREPFMSDEWGFGRFRELAVERAQGVLRKGGDVTMLPERGRPVWRVARVWVEEGLGL